MEPLPDELPEVELLVALPEDDPLVEPLDEVLPLPVVLLLLVVVPLVSPPAASAEFWKAWITDCRLRPERRARSQNASPAASGARFRMLVYSESTKPRNPPAVVVVPMLPLDVPVPVLPVPVVVLPEPVEPVPVLPEPVVVPAEVRDWAFWSWT